MRISGYCYLIGFLFVSVNILQVEGALVMEYEYGEKIGLLENKRIHLPDFSITFMGERQITSATYSPGFLFFDYEIQKGKIRKVISWSSGTGDISPTLFEIDNKKFVLEMGISDIIKFLKRGEYIVWQADAFNKSKK